MKYALAVLFEEFPRYDRVKNDGTRLHFYDGDTEIYQDDATRPYFIEYAKGLLLDFVDGDSKTEVLDAFRKRFPKHIVLSVIVEVPQS